MKSSRTSKAAIASLLVCVAGQAFGHDDAIAAPAPIGEVSPTSLYLRVGEVDLGAPRAGLGALAGERGRFVIQLDGPMTPDRRAALVNAGVRLGDYLPINSFVADFSDANADSLNLIGFVRWHGAFDAAWKVSPEIGQRELTTNERLLMQGLGMSALSVDLFVDADIARATEQIMTLDDRIDIVATSTIGEQLVLHVTAPTELVERLSALEDIQFIDEAPELTTRNESTAWIIQSNISGLTPIWDQGLTGEGQILGHIDDRIDINHCSFVDPEGDAPGPDHRKIIAYNSSFGAQTHGTHTAGTAAGDAGAANDTRGIAYDAKIAFDTIPSFNETAVYNVLTQHEGQGARVHANSWGNDGTTAYDGMARGFDRFLYDYEDNFVALAVTNQSLLRNPENAKNLLAVGASRAEPSQNSHCSGGSGPTSDGRRKPEVYAPGCSTRSASSNTSCSVRSLTGTSMACPAVSGMAILMRQYYMEGFYPTGAANPDDGFTPSGALLKATLVNSAVDMTGVSGYPSEREGWGRIVADGALYFDGDVRRAWVEDVRNSSGLDTGDSIEHSISVDSAGEMFKVTLVFTDPAASSNSSFAPVNDLDLEVVAPDGTVYLGNVFSNGFSDTGGAKDDRNNVEQVHISGPAQGEWTVRVKAPAVNVGMQGYALVVSGIISEVSECVADFNGDGLVNTQDVLTFLNVWADADSDADINDDGNVDSQDVLEFLNVWAAGC